MPKTMVKFLITLFLGLLFCDFSYALKAEIPSPKAEHGQISPQAKLTAFLLALQLEDFSLLESLKKELDVKDLNEVRDNQGRGLLHYALGMNARPQFMSKLLDHLDPNLGDKNGDTPLHFAVSDPVHIPRLQVLLQKADPNQGNTHATTPLINAVFSQNLQAIKILVQASAVIMQGDSKGNTALHWAATLDYKDIYALLISYGADPEQKNSIGLSSERILEVNADE